jgi:uncharacterized membrane protein YraQ (UPF0718 family)
MNTSIKRPFWQSKRFFLLLVTLLLWLLIYFNLQKFVDTLITDWLGLSPDSRWTSTLAFFIFEVPKVLLLLTLIVFFVGIIRSYFAPERTRRLLAGRNAFTGNVLASLLGVVTPFCSCSAIPLFLGFVEAGVPLGVTFSFLIAAPMINEIALVLLFGLFGWKIALLYMGTGLTIAILAGWIIGRLRLEKWVEDWVYEKQSGRATLAEEQYSFADRVDRGIEAVKEIVAKVWIYVVMGIAVGAGVHGWVPENYLAGIMGKTAWYSVPISVVIGIPLYSNAAGIIPIVQSLLEKGAALGTALAFMMAVIGLSLPETIILKKVLKLPLILTFVGIVGSGIMIVGFLFNMIH